MKRETALALVLALVVLFAPGCNAFGGDNDLSPKQQYAIALAMFTTTLDIVSELIEQGFITPEQKEKIDPYVAAADAALKLAKSLMDSEDVDAFIDAIDALYDATDEMNLWRVRGEAAKLDEAEAEPEGGGGE
jgi:hypothetical protein